MGVRHTADPEHLQRRLDELESRIRSLRMSRRVLLDLIRRVHGERQRRIEALEAEVARLRARNRTYALRLWEQNRWLASLGLRAVTRNAGEAGKGIPQPKEHEINN
ncbi:MAG TPA: translation initiation factor 2 [Bacillota bacterium]